MNAAAVEPQPAPSGAITAFGTNASRSSVLVEPRASSMSPVTAVIASGVCCRFSSRKRAVTTISSSAPGGCGCACAVFVAGNAAAKSRPGAPHTTRRIAARNA